MGGVREGVDMRCIHSVVEGDFTSLIVQENPHFFRKVNKTTLEQCEMCSDVTRKASACDQRGGDSGHQ